MFLYKRLRFEYEDEITSQLLEIVKEQNSELVISKAFDINLIKDKVPKLYEQFLDQNIQIEIFNAVNGSKLNIPTLQNEGKVKRPVNRWLELKNDESMHANKKLAVGLKELKYQLAEVEKFFSWYNFEGLEAG
jgi:hypothetical protein